MPVKSRKKHSGSDKVCSNIEYPKCAICGCYQHILSSKGNFVEQIYFYGWNNRMFKN